jgi:hypothetical protein
MRKQAGYDDKFFNIGPFLGLNYQMCNYLFNLKYQTFTIFINNLYLTLTLCVKNLMVSLGQFRLASHNKLCSKEM